MQMISKKFFRYLLLSLFVSCISQIVASDFANLEIYETAVKTACQQDDLELFTDLLGARVLDFTHLSKLVLNVVDSIVSHDSINCLKILFESQKSMKYIQEYAYITSCKYNAKASVEYLSTLVDPLCHEGKAFEFCLASGHTALFIFLFEYSRKIMEQHVLNNLLVAACHHGNVAITRLLLGNGADPTFSESLCLVEAIQNAHDSIVEILFEDGRIDLNVCHLKTSLSTVYSSSIPMFKLFLRYPKFFSLEDRFRILVQQALMFHSVRAGDKYEDLLEKLSLLTEYPDRVCLKCEDRHLNLICVNGCTSLFRILLKSEDVRSVAHIYVLRHIRKINLSLFQAYLEMCSPSIEITSELMKHSLNELNFFKSIVKFISKQPFPQRLELLNIGLSLQPSLGIKCCLYQLLRTFDGSLHDLEVYSRNGGFTEVVKALNIIIYLLVLRRSMFDVHAFPVELQLYIAQLMLRIQ